MLTDCLKKFLKLKILQKLLFCIFSFLLVSATQVASKATGDKNFTRASGERIYLKSKGISVTPPKGWEVHLEYPGLSLLLQPTFKKGMPYQRTIQVMTRKDPIYIDDITMREFQHELVRRYSGLSQSLENYEINQALLTKMEDGREGILYYARFNLEGKSLMQAHILVSGESRSYIITYTDVAAHFETEKGDHLNEAWRTMTSAKMTGNTPVRFRKALTFGISCLIFLLLSMLLYFVKQRSAKQSYSDYAQSDPLDTEAEEKSYSASKNLPSNFEENDISITGMASSQETEGWNTTPTGPEAKTEVSDLADPTRITENPGTTGEEESEDVWKV